MNNTYKVKIVHILVILLMFNTLPVQATSPSETVLSAKAKQRPSVQDHRKPSQRPDDCDNRKEKAVRTIFNSKRPNVQDHRKPSQRTDVCDNRKSNQRPTVRDHRKSSQRPDVRDHRKSSQRPDVRDHRKSNQRPTVRDHRKPNQRPDVRDHRKSSQRPDVRDHRRPKNTKKPSPPPRVIPQDKRDNDKDGIADSLEMALANKFAPILRLPPRSLSENRKPNSLGSWL